MTSKVVADLAAFGERLKKDGYPPAIVESAVIRMTTMEEMIIADSAELLYLRHFFQEADFGPAHGDVVQIIQDAYDGDIPEGYEYE